MRHALVLTLMILGGTAAAMSHPFFGILPYYVLSILKPQFLWSYSLPDFRWSLLAAGGAVLGVLVNLPRLITLFRWNAIATLMVIFAFLMLMSCLTAYNTEVAGNWGSEYLKIFIMAVLATTLIQSPQHVRWLGGMVFFVITYIAWEFNFRYFVQNRLDLWNYGHGGLDNNGAGLLIGMGIPFAYAWALSSRRKLVWLFCAAAALAMIHAVMISYSRGAMVSAIFGAVWILLHHRPRRHAIVALALLITVVIAMAGPTVRDRFATTEHYQTDESANLRFQSWEAAWNIAWDHPLTGVGVRNANLLSKAYGADMYGRTIHSQYLQIAADCGIPAISIYVLMCVLSITRSRSSRKALRRAATADSQSLSPDICRSMSATALAVETSLIIFMLGGVFLSLETFELPWLLLVLGGALPIVTRNFLSAAVGTPQTNGAATGLPTPPRHAPNSNTKTTDKSLNLIFAHLEHPAP